MNIMFSMKMLKIIWIKFYHIKVIWPNMTFYGINGHMGHNTWSYDVLWHKRSYGPQHFIIWLLIMHFMILGGQLKLILVKNIQSITTFPTEHKQ